MSERREKSPILPVFGADGEIENILVISIDVTDRRRAVEQRFELERQMQHAQKLESLGVLSGGIAHDFNNLLMSILGNADLAKQDLPTGHEGQHRLLEIEKASRRGAELAEQMLAYSGRGKFVIGRIHIGEFVAEMAHLLEVSVPKKTTLKLEIPADLPTFDGDATQVRQVIMNLITNATESMGEDGGVITVRAGVRDCDRAYLDGVEVVVQAGLDNPLPEGTYVYFEVADTGCGMDDAVRQKVFDPFFTTKFTGRGLGMAAVLGIVRGHKGSIRIASAQGKGSHFRVLFPVGKDQDSKRSSPVGPSVQADWRTTGTVLIADDEESVRSVGQEMLEHLGLQVLMANDGREAIETYRTHADIIDCVLLDLTMPELDGEQVFRELRRLHPEVKVILTSGYNLEDLSGRFQGMGLAGFLQKPFDLAALGAQVAKALGA